MTVPPDSQDHPTTELTDPSASTVTDKDKRRVFIATTLGVSVEWFDYAIYGVMAPAIAHNFFPDSDPAAGLIATFSIFAVSFLVRPLGSMYFGSRGDRKGRKNTLIWVILLMSFSTVAIGLIPSYGTLGLFAPVLLLVCRMIQGFSAGGEFGAGALLFEYIGAPRRGMIFGLFNLSSYVSSLGALGLATIVTWGLGADVTNEWGWRLCFLAALPLGLVGFYLRRGVDESPAFKKLENENRTAGRPVTEVMTQKRKPLIGFIGFIMLNSVAFYVLNTYLPTYLSENAGVDRVTALGASSLISLTMIIIQPLFGLLSDKIGRKPLLIYSAVALFVVSLPTFFIAGLGPFIFVYLGELLFVLAAAPTSALAAVIGAELFPSRLRYSGPTLGYNFAYAIFGGTAPLVCSWLLDITGSRLAPAYYVMAIAIIAAIVFAAIIPETAPIKLKRTTETTKE